MESRPWSSGDMPQVTQDFLFREGDALGNLQGRKGLLQKEVFDSLTDSEHATGLIIPRA
jgi:hypothetical protein